MRAKETNLSELNVDAVVRQQLEENAILFEKIAASLHCRHDEVPKALREVLRFLILVSRKESGQLTPSHRVDLAWHEFILCTRAYHEFCEAYFGRFIHHYPGGATKQNSLQFQETLKRYEQAFGTPDLEYWGAGNADRLECGTCDSI